MDPDQVLQLTEKALYHLTMHDYDKVRFILQTLKDNADPDMP